MTISNYNRFISQVIDLEYFHYTIWQLSEFKIPYIWDMTTTPVWSQHFHPILFFLVPIYWIVKNPGMLIIIQAGFVISGAIPIYLVVKNTLKSRAIGLSLSFAYLAFGGLQYGFEYGFHEIMFLPTLFLWMYYFYTCKKIKIYFLFVLLSLFVKEEVSFIIFFWGFYLFIIRKDKLLGMATAILGVCWYILCFNIVIPHFSNGGSFGYWGQYTQGKVGGIFGIAQSILGNPLLFLRSLVDPSYKIDTIFHSFGSFSFLLILYPPSLIIVIPSLFEKLLSSGIAGMSGAHYSAAITGVTVVASIESLLHILKYRFLINKVHNLKYLIAGLIFYIALSSNIIYGYPPLSLVPFVHPFNRPATDDNILFLSTIIDSIPEQASVSAQYQIAPHIQKPFGKIRTGPNLDESSDYVILDAQLPTVLMEPKSFIKNLGILSKRKDYRLIVNNLGVVVFKKIK